jgi:DNA-binding beta-propeller fold protein YncE
MRNIIAGCTYLLFVAFAGGFGTASADDDSHGRRGAVERFITLPDGVRYPEGITANPATHDVYIGTFDFGPNRNKLLRYSRHGRLEAQKDFGGTPLLGLAFDRAHGKVYIANFGASKIQRIAAEFDSSTAVEDVAVIPGIGAPANGRANNPDGSSDTIIFGSNKFPAPNALEFDQAGNLYVSDSFQGAIFRIDTPASCALPCPDAKLIVQDPLLATAGFPPFGANGLALSHDEKTLFVANTGDDRVLKLDLASKALTVFAVAFDREGRLWVAANQNDEVVALNHNGRVIARVGEFEGVRRDGSPEGLLFPASLVIVSDEMFVTNLALPLTAAVGDEPEEDVSRYTISRIRLPRR